MVKHNINSVLGRVMKLKLRTRKIWSALTIALLVATCAALGTLGNKLATAYEGDYWTVEYEGLSIHVESVSQNGTNLVPVSDGEDGYYFVTANNTDPVVVSMTVDGMIPGDSYYYYETDDYWNGRRNLTSEDNGTIIHEELKPHIYFQDDCHGDCYVDPMSGVYYVGASVSRVGNAGVQKNIVIRPTSIGSHNIDIISVKQNGTDLTLTNNEYQMTSYNTPLSITYKLKNLEIGTNYGLDIGYIDWYQFKAETTELTITRELSPNLVSKHVNVPVNLYSSGDSDQVNLYFKVVDESFRPLGDIIIDEIEQGGTALVAEADTSGWQRQYTFTANDAQSLVVRMHTTSATADMNYCIMFNMFAMGGNSYDSIEPLIVTGEVFEQQGVVLSIPAAFGMSDSSPFTLSFTVNTTGRGTGGSGSQKTVYKEYATPQNSSDVFKINVYEDENVPRFDAGLYYSDGTMIDSDRIDPARHDAEHPLLVEVRGERYVNEQTYNVRARVGEEYGEIFYDRTFTATGAQLNEGTVFTLEGLTLNLPVFDPTGATSGYELSYGFYLGIDDLDLHSGMLYMYNGWATSVLTYDGGEVVSMGSGGGIGGDYYTTTSGMTLRKTSLDGSKGAVLNYITHGFEDDLSYNYVIYLNGNAGEDWWSAPAGTSIENGVLNGSYLNTNGLSINVATPSNESESMLYTLVITRNGGLVRIVKDFIVFTNDPKIESFKFTADSDSFMQIDRASYRVATGTDVVATLYGDGFDDETEYKLWVSYEGYRYGEENEYGESYPEDVDLTSLNDSVVVTGAQLNAGYAYTLHYVEALDGVNFVEIGFALTDVDAAEPSQYWESGNGSYSGHGIHIDYVNDDEVFRDDGYQINEDGSITDVSQPDQPGGIPVDDRTPGDVEVHVENETTLVLVSSKPTLVIGFKDGHYQLVAVATSIDDEGVKTNSYDIEGFDEIKIVLKGDGDMDGGINSGDSNLLNRSLISNTLGRYRALSELEQVIFDLDGDGNITSADSNLLNRSLISNTLGRYKKIQW